MQSATMPATAATTAQTARQATLFRMVMPGHTCPYGPSFPVSRIGTGIEWRIAPVPQGPEGDLAEEVAFTNIGRGLRPFAPVQLRARRDPATGDIGLSWIRRTRIGGDAWLADVPLGEEAEDYAVSIINGAIVVRSVRTPQPAFLYTAAQQGADFGTPPASLTWSVAQVSRVYGAGIPAQATHTL
jgi:hypothetical protein